MKQNEARRAIRTAHMVKFKTTSKKRQKAEEGIYIGGKARAKLLKKVQKLKNQSVDNKKAETDAKMHQNP